MIDPSGRANRTVVPSTCALRAVVMTARSKSVFAMEDVYPDRTIAGTVEDNRCLEARPMARSDQRPARHEIHADKSASVRSPQSSPATTTRSMSVVARTRPHAKTGRAPMNAVGDPNVTKRVENRQERATKVECFVVHRAGGTCRLRNGHRAAGDTSSGRERSAPNAAANSLSSRPRRMLLPGDCSASYRRLSAFSSASASAMRRKCACALSETTRIAYTPERPDAMEAFHVTRAPY